MSKNNPKIIGLIQANYIGWNGAPDFSLSKIGGKYAIEFAIEKLKSVPSIGEIVIAVPKNPHNLIFKKIAKANDVSCFFGSPENVLLRSIKATDSIKGNIVVHVMGQHCFIDPVLLEKMINSLKSNKSDYVSLPDNFTPYFAGKIYRRILLDRIKTKIEKVPVNQQKVFRSRFFAFIENNRDKFNTFIYKKTPNYSNNHLEKMRLMAREIFIDDRLHIDPKKVSKISNPLFESYKLAIKYVRRTDIILDVACGDGFGSRLLSPHAAKIIGLDINKKLIQKNNRENKESSIIYETGDACAMNFNNQSFDMVTGMEIIEHIPPIKVNKFLSEVSRVLKQGGIFVCSTPQNSMGAIPIVPWHEKEYSLSELKKVLGRKFSNIKIYGSKSGGPLTENELGQKMVAVCKTT